MRKPRVFAIENGLTLWYDTNKGTTYWGYGIYCHTSLMELRKRHGIVKGRYRVLL